MWGQVVPLNKESTHINELFRNDSDSPVLVVTAPVLSVGCKELLSSKPG